MNDIKDALTRVAATGAPAPLTLDRVRGRARQVRRRRTATALVGTAAAVAAIAGIGVAVSPSGSHDRGSVPPAAQTPTRTASPTRVGDADAVGPVFAVALDVDADHTFGGEPQVPYWSDGRIVDTDGSTTPLPDRPFTFARIPRGQGGGWMVLRPGTDGPELVRLVEGRPVGPPMASTEHGLLVGPDGGLVTLIRTGGSWMLGVGEGGFTLPPGDGTPQLDGVLPDGDVLFRGADGALRRGDADTLEDSAVKGAAAAVSSSQTGLLARGLEDGTWQAQAPDGSTRWSLDWAGVSSFSPDGRYVALVGDPQHRLHGSEDWDSDGAVGALWIRDAATLAPVAAFTPPRGGYFWGWTWDGDALVTNLFLHGEWSLVRLGEDGVRVGRGTAQQGGGEEPAYVFAAQ